MVLFTLSYFWSEKRNGFLFNSLIFFLGVFGSRQGQKSFSWICWCILFPFLFTFRYFWSETAGQLERPLRGTTSILLIPTAWSGLCNPGRSSTLRECGRQQSDLECQRILDLSSRAMWTSTFKILNLLVQKLKPVRPDPSGTTYRMKTKRENQAL